MVSVPDALLDDICLVPALSDAVAHEEPADSAPAVFSGEAAVVVTLLRSEEDPGIECLVRSGW